MKLFYKYIDDVLNDRVVVGKLVKLAVERHVNDIKRQSTDSFPYVFNEKEVEKHLKFFELCRHWKGPKAGHNIHAEACQWFFLGSLHGWKHAETGIRRFHTVVKMVGRKNTKTTEAAITALDHMFFQGDQGAQILAGATKEEQATIVVNDAGKIIQRTSELSQYFKLFKYKDKINRIATSNLTSSFKPLGRDSEREDGADPSFGIIDEYHAHPDDSIYNIIESGMGNRPDWLMMVITTAGANKYGPCYAVMRKAGVNTLTGVQVDDNSFYMMYELDDDDDWNDQDVWVKANPMMGASVNFEDYLVPRYQKAKIMGGEKETDFKIKNLNRWVDQYDTWIPDDIWMEGNKGGKMDDLHGMECYGGLDLAAVRDFNALVLCFPLGEGFALVPFFWIPRDVAEQRKERMDIDPMMWVNKGFIRICGLHTVDREQQAKDIQEICAKFNVKSIGVDPAMSHEIVPKIDINQGGFVKVTPFKQDIRTMSPPTKKFEELVFNRALNHMGNPVLRWMMTNVAVYRDANDNMKLVKDKGSDRIDGIVASVMAIGEWMTFKDVRSVYEDRGVITYEDL